MFCTVSTNSYVKKDPTLSPVRQGRKAHLHFSPLSCYSHSFSFYLQTDTGVWRKHVDIVFTQWINNNCFSPVNEMCSKLENLQWENREKLGEQKSKPQSLSRSSKLWRKVLFELKWKKNVPSFHPAFRINSGFNITCGTSKSIWQGYEFPEVRFTFLSNLVFPALTEFLQTISIEV